MKFNKITNYLFCLTVVTLLICSCKKSGQIGLDVQPTTDLFSSAFMDSTTVLSFVQKSDSLKTNGTPLLLLGNYTDPIFGTTTCSFYSQLNFLNNANNVDFSLGSTNPTDLALDSAVLTLQHTTSYSENHKMYGSLDPQTINVYTLTEGLSIDSTYYSTRQLSYNPSAIGTKTFTPQPDSTVTLKGIKYPPHVRIKIDSAFARTILLSPASDLITSTVFHTKVLQGLYVTSTSGGGILYFDPYGTYTKLTLYYRRNVSNPAKGDTISYSFEINGSAAHFNNFQHDYTTATDPKAVLPRLTNTSNDTDLIYVQSAAGIRTKITIPYLKNWISGGPIVINKAEFILKVDRSTVTTNYYVHPQLFLTTLDSVGKINYDTSPFYLGVYDIAKGEYHFTVSFHIQSILNGKIKDYGYYLLPAANSNYSGFNADRTVLYGASKTSNKLKFRLTYTKL